MTLKIVRRAAGADCAAILAELPDWFGIPESNAAYAQAAERGPTFVAERDGEALGLLVVEDLGFAALDIHLMAVRPLAHRQGIGRLLVEQARAVARELGKPYLTVKTQGPSAGHESYARTRAFYEGVGFQGLEETVAFWGEANPCLIMLQPA